MELGTKLMVGVSGGERGATRQVGRAVRTGTETVQKLVEDGLPRARWILDLAGCGNWEVGGGR